jgi:GrpB-like predicted nucleotidyltransferase (UPF0157 family)
VIRITVEVQHAGGSIEVVEADPHLPQSADAARRAVETTCARALARARHAIEPEDPRHG